MRFKLGDKVVLKRGGHGNDPLVVKEFAYNPRTQSINYRVDGVWCEEYELSHYDQAADTLVTKILERNNKPSIQDQLEENLLELLDEDDKVNSPSHYTKGDVEVIDIIKQLTQGYEPFEAYLVGNTIKYLARANYKENKQQDLEKTQWHINKLLEEQNK